MGYELSGSIDMTPKQDNNKAGHKWKTNFPGEKVDYHLKKFGHLPDMDCGPDVTDCLKSAPSKPIKQEDN